MWRFTALAVVAGMMSVQSAAAQNPVIIIDTNKGKITCELFADKSPETVKNILKYVDDKHYDGLIFHRVIPTFMIQGGGLDADMTEKRGRPPIKNEAGNGLSNVRGTLAMARTNDPDSATAQFFINVKDNRFLDRSNESAGYAVFGKVADEPSMEVVDAIRVVPTTTRRGHENVPQDPVVIRSIRRK